MNSVQLRADILHNLDVLSQDESMLERVSKYLRRLVNQWAEDPTCMTKEEFAARIREAQEEPSHELLPGEDLTAFLKRRGYDIRCIGFDRIRSL